MCHMQYNPLASKALIKPSNIVLTSIRVADEIDVVELRDLAERNNQVRLAVLAARAANAIQPELENAVQFIKDRVYDHVPENYPAWDMLYELFAQIRALPGCAHAFRELLINVEFLRIENRDKTGFLRSKLDQMAQLLADRARKELDAYNPKDKNTIRPADTYRAYGLALRYATEELGNFAARKTLAQLMMASPLPVDELENPGWIDSYTAEQDGDYEYLKVKEPADVSSDGNLPQMIQDLLDNMGEDNASIFQAELIARGSSLEDYFNEFRQAQRSGYSTMPEPEDDWEEPEFDVIEKDFSFAEDLKVSEAALKAREMMVLENKVNLIAGMKEAVAENIKFSEEHREGIIEDMQEILIKLNNELEFPRPNFERTAYYRARDFATDALHNHLLDDPRVRAFLRRFQDLIWRFPIPDMMSIMLQFQNGYGIWEDDLFEIKVPDTFHTLAHWFEINGEEFLEQFVSKENVDYGDPAVNKAVGNRYIQQYEMSQAELDEFALKTVWLQNEKYQDCEKRREEWVKAHNWRYKQDAKWHPMFVYAEIQTAFLGDGGSQNAQAAGWDAWREAVDKDANYIYKWERKHGAKHGEAMAKFWEVVKRNKNGIASLNKDGVTLKSGRKITWSILLLKFKANEIPMQTADLERLLMKMTDFSLGTAQLRVYLQERIEKEKAQLQPA